MKYVITAILIAFSHFAHAETFADTTNKGGGKIAILTDWCVSNTSLKRAYFYTKDGYTEDGCWYLDGDTIVIEWTSEGRRRYPVKIFKLRNGYRDFR
jgi:hypothetical protein